MFSPIDPTAAQEASALARTSPLLKLGLAVAWLVSLALTLEPTPPLRLTAVAIAAGLMLGRIAPGRLVRGIAPLVVGAASIAVANLLFSAANGDPSATQLARIGPMRLTREAADAAASVGARILAIVTIGTVFAQTTDPTRLVDSLVQQARLPARFAYGALAAYQAIPRLGEDLATLRAARRIRGLGGWRPRLLVGLLVRAIRHADQLALAMDARAFGSGPRTTFRPISWGLPDLLVGAGGVVALWLSLLP